MRRAFLVGALALFAGCSLPTGPTATDRGAVFDQLWRDIDLHYSFFDLKKINWDSLGAVYRPRALAASTELGFADVVTQMLEGLHDQHVYLFAEGQTFMTSGTTPTVFYPERTTAKYVTPTRQSPSGKLAYGMATPTVGYIRILTFEREWPTSEFDDALTAMTGATSLIIDVRDNGGGSAALGAEIAGRFANTATTYARVRYRNGPSHSDFGAFIDRVVVPSGRRFSGSVYVLTNRRSLSASEDFVLAMKAAARATIVGDPTGGASGSPIVRELPNGWTYQYPEWIEYTLDNRTYEDIGLVPDVAVNATFADVQRSVDAQLARALQLATTATGGVATSR
jgi:hypothetical protein